MFKKMVLTSLSLSAVLFSQQYQQQYDSNYPYDQSPQSQNPQNPQNQQMRRQQTIYGNFPVKSYDPFPSQSSPAIQQMYGQPQGQPHKNYYENDTVPNPDPFPSDSSPEIQRMYQRPQ